MPGYAPSNINRTSITVSLSTTQPKLLPPSRVYLCVCVCVCIPLYGFGRRIEPATSTTCTTPLRNNNCLFYPARSVCVRVSYGSEKCSLLVKLFCFSVFWRVCCFIFIACCAFLHFISYLLSFTFALFYVITIFFSTPSTLSCVFFLY